MKSRPALTPWLAQLFVAPDARCGGVGAALVTAAIAHAGRCGFSKLYLYTSGTLPRYYARLGWDELEWIEYLGKERVVMQYVINRA
jgi:N-acetylglutamate synthase-like GNAT family acetyltransferase